jgi:hypothetical protein
MPNSSATRLKGDLYFTYMNVLTVKTKWAIGTIIIGSGNKKLEFDKINKDYQFLYIESHFSPTVQS